MRKSLSKPFQLGKGSKISTQEIYSGDDNLKKIGTSFFRGKHCNFNPYDIDFSKKNFIEKYVMLGLHPDVPVISPNTVITTFGSCFAMHIGEYLHRNGYCLQKDKYPDIYVSQIGEGLVNTYAILQQFEWALENIKPPTNLWHGYKAQDFGYDEKIRLNTASAFLKTEFFIITLGLSEIWYDIKTNGVFWRAIPMRYYDATRHKFRVATTEENKFNLEKIYSIIKKHVPHAKVLFTLSPIPLAATFRNTSCIVANTVSKANLRSAVDQFIFERIEEYNKYLFYFPSFEIVSELFPHKFTEDRRHVRDYILNFVMYAFETYYCKSDKTRDDVETLFKEVRSMSYQDKKQGSI